jgi:hypothetical protein
MTDNTPENSRRLLGWSAMLAKWTEFAQASVALPADNDGPRWRACVAPIITMQAIVAALGELDQLHRAHRPVAIDAAESLLREQLVLIHTAWSGELIPDSLLALIDECRGAVFAARHMGVEWRVIDERIEAPDLRPIARMLIEAGYRGEFFAAHAGTALFRGAPLAFFRPAMAVNPPDGCGSFEIIGPRQCYRQLDEATGLPVRDVVAGPGDPLQPGAPLLAPLIIEGVPSPPVAFSAPIAIERPLPVVELG